jgi:DNA modification methylase
MECYRVLKPNHFCAILMGDTRRKMHYIPVAYRTLISFLEAGFILREDIIKHQWQCKSTSYWIRKSMESNFLMIMHEHLFVFRKPAENEKLKKFKESMF